MYEIDEKLTRRLYRTIEEHESLAWLKDAEAQIIAVRSDKSKTDKGRLILADCRTVPAFWKAFAPYDFIITVYEPNTEELDDHQMDVLLWHELLHCGISEKGNVYRIQGHDIEEFREIIEAEGMDWAKWRDP